MVNQSRFVENALEVQVSGSFMQKVSTGKRSFLLKSAEIKRASNILRPFLILPIFSEFRF